MKKVNLAVAIIVFAGCGPKVGDRKNGMVFGKGFSGKLEWMPEEDYDRFFSTEARKRGKRKLREFNHKYDEMKRKMKASENAQKILNGHR